MPPQFVPSLSRSLVIGGLGFAAVSLCVFATVAFAETWMYRNLGLGGAYFAWTALFILLGGGALGSLVVKRWRLPKFYLLFGLSFFLYAAGWVTSYFTLHGTTGELAGLFVGSILMAVVFAIGFSATGSLMKLAALLFVANCVGYFPGSALNDFLGGGTGMLLWGVVYGLSLGAGIGAVLHFVQLHPTLRGKHNLRFLRLN